MPFDFAYVETKPAIFSLEGLIAWLETQDPETEYDWGDSRNCLIGRYLLACGVDMPEGVYGNACRAMGVNDPPGVHIHSSEPHTYGAALNRAKELLAEREQ